MADRVHLFADARAMIGETPIAWQGGVLWTDPVSRCLLHASSELTSDPVDQPIWSLAILPDGTLVGATDDALTWRDGGGAWRTGVTAALSGGCRFNDMTTDQEGGLWIGAMHRGILATRGAIYRATGRNAPPMRVADGLGVPNGMKVSADGNTLFVIDTLARTLLAYPIDDRALGEPVIVSDFMNVPGKPDGMALAPDGCFHVAMWGGGCVAHLSPDGATLGLTELPVPHVSSVGCLAADRLAVSTSRMRLSPEALDTHPLSGGLFVIDLGEPA